MAATHFPVKVGSERRQVACYCAKPPADAEINVLKTWTGGASVRGQDAAELARLAALKWEIACELGIVASSLAEIDATVQANPKTEITGMVLAEARWFEPGLLGVCLFHRTWAGNVFLDFLAVHPETEGSAARVSGVGTGLLYRLCEVTHHLRAGLLWGETTAGSEPFYRGVFRLAEESDRLLVTPSQQEVFRRSVRERWEREQQT